MTLNSKNVDFDSKFMQEVIALNIWTFIALRRFMFQVLGLDPNNIRCSQQEMCMDIEALALQYHEDDIHIFHANHSQPYMAINAFTAGVTKLENGQLAEFLNQTCANPAVVHMGLDANATV